jgi:hypothetical protein
MLLRSLDHEPFAPFRLPLGRDLPTGRGMDGPDVAAGHGINGPHRHPRRDRDRGDEPTLPTRVRTISVATISPFATVAAD